MGRGGEVRGVSEMINRLNLKRGDYHCSSFQASGTDVQESGYLKNSRGGGGCGGGRGCAAVSRAGRQAYYWKIIFSLSGDEVQKGMKEERKKKGRDFILFFSAGRVKGCSVTVYVNKCLTWWMSVTGRHREGCVCVCVF